MEDKPDETPDAEPSSVDGPRKRPAPTIDLTASERTETPQQSATADAASPAQPRTGWRAAFSTANPGESAAEQDAVERDMGTPPKQDAPSHGRTAIIAALSGAVVALVVAGGWTAFESSLRTNETDSAAPAQNLAIDVLNTRLAKLENKPAPASRDDDRIQSVLAALGNEMTSLRKDVGSLRAQIETASANVALLKSSATDSVPSQALAGIEDRVSKLEQSTAALSQPRPATEAADDAPLRRAVVATTLDQSVSQGAPYAMALAAVAKLDDNADALRSLQVFASGGVPTAAQMSRELLKLLQPLEDARTPVPASASLMDRLRASVFGLVRITRVDQAGTDRAALLMRAKAAAQHEDVPEARRVVMQLPDQDRAALKDWIDKAAAREAALAASRQLAQDAMAAIPKSSPGTAQ